MKACFLSSLQTLPAEIVWMTDDSMVKHAHSPLTQKDMQTTHLCCLHVPMDQKTMCRLHHACPPVAATANQAQAAWQTVATEQIVEDSTHTVLSSTHTTHTCKMVDIHAKCNTTQEFTVAGTLEEDGGARGGGGGWAGGRGLS